jgi:hypothetical protein
VSDKIDRRHHLGAWFHTLEGHSREPPPPSGMRQAVQDTVVVQAMTGHSSDRMTEHYSFVSDGEKQKALSQLFEKLGPGLADPLGTGKAPGDQETDSDA